MSTPLHPALAEALATLVEAGLLPPEPHWQRHVPREQAVALAATLHPDDLNPFMAALEPLFPTRGVFYDTESIYADDAYGELLREHAAATGGEWQPEIVAATLDEDRPAVTFRHHGQVFAWTFERDSKWVRSAFWDALEAFATTHLSGTFFPIPVFDQTALFLYLPQAVAAELAYLHEQYDRLWQEHLMEWHARLTRSVPKERT